MTTIKNVAIAGASGNLGIPVLNGLLAAGSFNITVLTRPGSADKYRFLSSSSAKVVEVDYSSVDSLTNALKGQDAVISTVGTAAAAAQTIIVDAAIAAGVKRFLPADFGSNIDNALGRALPVFVNKVKIQNYLIEKSKSSSLTYTFVYNSAFLDWGLQNNFIFDASEYKPKLFDGGNAPFSATSLASVADAVVGVLNHLEETKNRAVYISDIIITQNRILELAKELAPDKPWAPVVVKLDDLTKKADERLAKGLYDGETFAPYIFRAIFDPAYESAFEKNDNELLGVKGKIEDDVKAYLKPLLK